VYADIGSDTLRDSTFKGIDILKIDTLSLGIEMMRFFGSLKYFFFS